MLQRQVCVPLCLGHLRVKAASQRYKREERRERERYTYIYYIYIYPYVYIQKHTAYIYIYTQHKHIHTTTKLCIPTKTYIDLHCTSFYIHRCICIWRDRRMCHMQSCILCLSVCMYACIYVYMYVCMYVCRYEGSDRATHQCVVH